MEDVFQTNTRQFNFDWIIIAGVCAILTLAVTLIGLSYNLSGVEQADRWKTTFEINQSTAIIQTAKHWDNGSLLYGVNQTAGIATTTKYDLWWKKSNGSYNLEFSGGYCTANNTYYGAWYMHSPNGISLYTYKMIKKTNLNTKSVLLVDLMLT